MGRHSLGHLPLTFASTVAVSLDHCWSSPSLVPHLSADRLGLHIRVASDMAYGKGQTDHVQVVRKRGKTVLLSVRLSIYVFELGPPGCGRQGESNGHFAWNIG
jgi:hypothetical protein